ncbi:hypothetical protein AB0C13_32410 [Streptomyces sp. NPDC049099]|uniref:hypothetical protein n=1 Tax=Streptomyces sp. NPDC049099 TaxID=3155768 RepID=UPI003441A620
MTSDVYGPPTPAPALLLWTVAPPIARRVAPALSFTDRAGTRGGATGDLLRQLSGAPD